MTAAPATPEPSVRPRRAYIRGTAVLFASLLVGLLLAEGIVRLTYPLLADYNTEMTRYSSELKEPYANPRLPFHHYPNRSGTYYGVEISTNSFGFRDREYSVESPKGITRILVLGDSMTVGWGVPMDTTFSKKLEQKLNENGVAAEVINLGIGNYNTRMEVELFKLKGLQFRPDIVVLAYYVNDAEPVPHTSRLRYQMMSHSYLFGFLFRTYVNIKARMNLSPKFGWHEYYEGLYSETSAGLRDNSHAFRELTNLCNQQGIKLLTVNIPELRQLKDYPLAIATQYIEGLAKENEVPFRDLLPVLIEQAPESLWVTVEDPHASVKAHALIAQGIHQALLDFRMLAGSQN